MFHEEVAQIPVVPTPVTMLSVALMGKRLYSLGTADRGKKQLGSVLLMVLYVPQARPS